MNLIKRGLEPVAVISVVVSVLNAVAVADVESFQTLAPAMIESGDGFGTSVAIDGNVAVVGAPFDDDRGADAGAVYVFFFDGNLWQLTEKVTASDGDAGHHFGAAVAVDVVADLYRVAVGAPGAERVYIFDDAGSGLIQVAQLDEGTDLNSFGTAVSLEGDFLAIGDPGLVLVTGFVSIYRRDAGIWQPFDVINGAGQSRLGAALSLHDLRLVASQESSSLVRVFQSDGNAEFEEIGTISMAGVASAGFASDLDQSGDYLVLGSPGADPVDAGTDAGEIMVGNIGSVPPANWSFNVFRPSDGDAGDRFGASVSLSGDQMIIGAPGDDDIAFDAGAVYVYQRFGGNVWIEAGKFYSTSAEPYDQFGSAVALHELAVLAATPLADGDGIGVDAGSAYAFSLADCNNNGLIDGCDVALGLSVDCDVNGVLDECELTSGEASDLNDNGTIDVCDPDCDTDGQPDDYEINVLGALDCNQNGVPDDCDLEAPPVDLIFIMDTSGSMDDEAAALCDSIFDVVDDLSDDGVPVLPQLYGIADAPGGDFDCLTETVLGIFGPDVPGDPDCCPTLGNIEDWGPATAIVAENYPWTANALRVIVPISDEGPRNGSEEDDGDQEAIDNAIIIANQNGVVVSPIIGTGGEGAVFDFAQQLATATGGFATLTVDPDADFGNAIKQIVFSVLSLDCNENGVPDECDIEAGLIADCNGNGRADFCEIADGLTPDCNGNEIPDGCEAPFVDVQSGMLGPIGSGATQVFQVADAPEAGSDVTLTVKLFGDFSGLLETVTVRLNGTDLATVSGSAGVDCPGEADEAMVSVSAAAFNDALSASDATFGLIASSAVDPSGCGGASWVSLQVSYQAISESDCDGNGTPDDCDIALNPELDSNGNGTLDSCESGSGADLNDDDTVSTPDLLLLLSQWGTCFGCPADLDGDGAVDVADLLDLLASWGQSSAS